MDLTGKVVLITGGAERAGKIFALECAKAGADIAISHWNTHREAVSTKAEIVSLGRRCLSVEADMRNIPQLVNLVGEIEKAYGRLDVLVHNASNFNQQPLDQVTPEIWDSSMEIILKGAFFLSQAAVPLMLKNGGGKIIAMGGNSYYENWAEFIPHSIAKTGLVKLMQTLAIALSPAIQCFSICPSSFLDSGSGDDILAARGEVIDSASSTLTVNGVNLHRGNPYEVAQLILFLACSNRYLNGAVIPIDGGKHLI